MTRRKLSNPQDVLTLLTWRMHVGSLIAGTVTEEALGFLNASIAHHRLAVWLQDVVARSRGKRDEAVVQLLNEERLDEAALSNLTTLGFRQFVNTSPNRKQAMRAIAAILLDRKRLVEFLDKLCESGIPSWAKPRNNPDADVLAEPLRKALDKALLERKSFEQTLNDLLDEAAKLGAWAVDQPVERAATDDTGCCPCQEDNDRKLGHG